jgi:cation-transporting ATPase E
VNQPVTERPTTGVEGLSSAEAAQRTAQGLSNVADDATSRPLGQIIRSNVVTPFNGLLGGLLVAVLVFGSPRDGLFGFVLVINSLAGIVQEVRAKRTLDRLAVLNAPTAAVVRDGASVRLALDDIVLDDLVELAPGDQVPADGVVTSADALEVDESLLTGESDPVVKTVGDEVRSGSFVVAGSGRFQATAVGAAAYARTVVAEAKAYTRTKSELMGGIGRLLRYITWAILIVGPILLISQLRSTTDGVRNSTREAVTGTVAGLIGMVPEGLVLLTSAAFLLAALTLARRNVLVQELPAVEGLARVDVVCADKTGTLTEGTIEFARYALVGSAEERPGSDDDGAVPTPDGGPADSRVRSALAALAADTNPNATAQALADVFWDRPDWTVTAKVAFSSSRKWSGTTFQQEGTYVLGAPEIVLSAIGGEAAQRAAHQADAWADEGQRVVVLAAGAEPLEGDSLPGDLVALALVAFDERVRPDAAETLRYFASQGVTVKIISGDNPRTVAAVARRVGLDPGVVVDARTLPDEPGALADAVDAGTVFGRVTPQQKRAMVRALQSRGHVVAMTGDGVNDALALKDADIGVAMGSGAPATRAVAQIVLMDGRFAHLPDVVAEGRRVMANVERVANLFVIKNVYAMVLALAVAGARWPYPFLPRHLTLISSLTIGIPGFFLALAPNSRRYEPGFLRRVLRFTAPTGVVSAAAVFAAYTVARTVQHVKPDQARTAAFSAIMVIGLWVLALLSRPLVGWKLALLSTMAGLFALALVVPWSHRFFTLDIPATTLGLALAIGSGGAALVTMVSSRAFNQQRSG